jgi:site-specific DNA recombinase
LHAPILDDVLWNRIQAKLQAASARPRGRTDTNQPYRAPLTGKLRDDAGDRLTPSYARRDGRLIRYYVSNRLISGGTDPRAWRLPAVGLERAVAKAVGDHLIELGRSHRLLLTPDLQRASLLQTPLRNLADQLTHGDPILLANILAKGTLEAQHIALTLCAETLVKAIAVRPDEIEPSVLAFDARFSLRRRGIEGKIVIGDPAPQPDGALLRALSKAHAWASELRGGKPISAIASAAGYSEAYIRTRAQLAFLSPMIQNAILLGTHPPEFSLEKVLRTPMPLDWDQQAKRYGFTGRDTYP